MASLISSLANSIRDILPTLLTHPHASPPIRLLLLVLSPDKPLPSLDSTGNDKIRSKKSEKYRKGQGVQGQSIFGEQEQLKGKGKEAAAVRRLPDDLLPVPKAMYSDLVGRISPAEWRSMGADPVGNVAVQVSICLTYTCEAEQDRCL
jgi:nucleolar protein 9